MNKRGARSSSSHELSLEDSDNINQFQNFDENKMIEGLDIELPDINSKNKLPSMSPLPDINPNPQPS